MATSTVEGYNIALNIGGKTVLGRTQEDLSIAAVTTTSITKDDAGVQFSHSIEEQIGGQLRAGFRLLDVYQDSNGSGFLHEHGVPTFWATLAQKPED